MSGGITRSERRARRESSWMNKSLKPGTDVTWDSAQGTTHGTVEKKVTSTTRVKGHVAKATKDEPQYLVKSAKTGAKAVHKPEGLHPAKK
jgi:hypothetical protein